MNNIFSCDHVGISGTTDVFVMKVQSSLIGEEIFEARVGIAIMGSYNRERKSNNPFENQFKDNFARGYGTTSEKAIEALKNDMKSTANALWA